MKRFLIELPHDSEGLACARFVKVALTLGSHFLTRADWGCEDGVHNGWVIVEADSKEDARLALPPQLRRGATIVALNYFTLQEIEAILGSHGA
jgi:hypothetical protein